MILRVFHVTVHDGMAVEFENFFRTIVVPLVKSFPGMLSIATGKPRPATPNDFCMTMIWKDVGALKNFAGENWREARIEPEEEHLIASNSVTHYDLMAASGSVEL
jgi:hypothetical protein